MKRDPYRKERVAVVLNRALMEVIRRNAGHFKYKDITVSYIKMSNDLRIANVYCRSLFAEGQTERDMRALAADFNDKAALIRRKIAPLVYLKYLPELRFYYDRNPEEEERLREILERISQESTLLP